MKHNILPMGSGRTLTRKFEGIDFEDSRNRSRVPRSFYGATAKNAADYLNSKFTAKITLINGLSHDVKVALHPGYFGSVADINASRKLTLDAIIAEGDIITEGTETVTKLTGHGEPYNIVEMLLFTKLNPQCFTHLKITVDEAEQLDNIVEILYLSPYRSLGDDRITPSNYKDADQQNDKIADIPLSDFQMSDQTLIYTTISAGRRATYLWSVGATLNSAALLQESSAKYQAALAGVVAK
jgi:hypothetical protein